jgi:transposase-like protein
MSSQGFALSREELQHTLKILHACGGNKRKTARKLGIDPHTLRARLARADRAGLNGFDPVLESFEVTKTKTTKDRDGNVRSQTIEQKPAPLEEFEIPKTHVLSGKITAHIKDGQVVQAWPRYNADTETVRALAHVMAQELAATLPKYKPTQAPKSAPHGVDKLNQYTLADAHFGMLAWGEETGARDWDLKIAEQTVLDWFAAAIAGSPDAEVGMFAQLGDLMHHDALRSVTPAHMHVLDADSRLQKIIRVVIRVVRRVIQWLLEKHQRVHIIMATGNHDESSSAWMREGFASQYEHEPRITVDISPGRYYAYEHGRTALFYHHGDKWKIDDVDKKFVSLFREIYGRSSKAYAHVGHLHSLKERGGELMVVERHRTLAPPDAHGADWITDSEAQVITYDKNFGETSRLVLTPKQVMGASQMRRLVAA